MTEKNVFYETDILQTNCIFLTDSSAQNFHVFKFDFSGKKSASQGQEPHSQHFIFFQTYERAQ